MNATKSLVILAVLCAAVTLSASPEPKTVRRITIIDYAPPQPKPVAFWFRWVWVVLP